MTDQPAGGADLSMATEFRRPAQLDRAHHAALDAPEMTGMSMAIGITVVAENIRHFQTG